MPAPTPLRGARSSYAAPDEARLISSFAARQQCRERAWHSAVSSFRTFSVPHTTPQTRLSVPRRWLGGRQRAVRGCQRTDAPPSPLVAASRNGQSDQHPHGSNNDDQAGEATPTRLNNLAHERFRVESGAGNAALSAANDPHRRAKIMIRAITTNASEPASTYRTL